MKVGALEESVTVSGASPVVDVQSNVKSQVLSRETLDAVPNAHTIQSVGQLIPGVTLTSPDVGGSVQMQQTYFSVHGTGANGTSMTVDGMIINGLMLDGAVQTYMNDATPRASSRPAACRSTSCPAKAATASAASSILGSRTGRATTSARSSRPSV